MCTDTRTGSAGIEESPFAHDRGRQRRAQMQPRGERRMGPHQDVTGRRKPPEGLVGAGASPQGGGDIVAHDHEQVVVTLGAGRASGARAEEIDALGLIGLDESVENLDESRVLGRYTELPPNQASTPRGTEHY